MQHPVIAVLFLPFKMFWWVLSSYCYICWSTEQEIDETCILNREITFLVKLALTVFVSLDQLVTSPISHWG